MNRDNSTGKRWSNASWRTIFMNAGDQPKSRGKAKQTPLVRETNISSQQAPDRGGVIDYIKSSVKADVFKEEDLKVEDIVLNGATGSGWVYRVRHKAMGDVLHIMSAPTANCQIQSIYNFAGLQQYTDNDIITLLKVGWEGTQSKTLFLIDTYQSAETLIRRLFENDEILTQTNYLNNTGSNMCLWLVQIKSMLRRRDLIE